MTRMCPSLAALCAAIALGGCNAAADGTGPVVSAPVTPSAFRLPPGASCSDEIDAYQGVVSHDLETGNVEQKVYDQIKVELSRAAAACSAGKGGEAHAIVAGSKARHGYRA